MKHIKLIATLNMLFTSVLHAAEPLHYAVKPGETLSGIAYKQIPGPVFGVNGSLANLMKSNPDIHDINLIYAGQVILIPNLDLRQRSLSVTPTANKSLRTPAQQDQQESPHAQVNQLPASCPAETSMASIEKIKSAEIPHRFSIDTSMGMTTLSATDASTTSSANISSSTDIAVQAGWTQEWTDSVATKVSAKFRGVEFQSPNSGTKTLSDSKKNLTAIAVGVSKKISSKFSLHSSFSYGHELFLRGLSTSGISMDAVAIPKVTVASNYELYSAGKTSLSGNIGLEYLFSGTSDGYSINSGSSIFGGLTIRREFGRDKALAFSLGYADRSQSTSAMSLHEKSVPGSVTLILPMFEESEKR